MTDIGDIFKCSVNNLFKKKMRTALSVLAIVIGVSSVVIINSIAECGKFAVNTELESLGMKGITITKSTSASGDAALDSRTLEIIENQPLVDQAMPVTVFLSTITAHDTSMESLLFGVDEHADSLISLKVLYGRGISKADVSARSKVCLVDQALAQKLYKRDNMIGKTFELSLKGKTESFEVVGVVRTGSGLLQNMIGSYVPTLIYMPYTTMQQMSGEENFSQITVLLNDDQKNDQAGEKILETIASVTGGPSSGYKAENLMKQREGLSNLMNIITLVLSMVGFIAMIVASLGIMTIMLVSVGERTREIGVKKAIGASKANICLEFLIEAFLMSAAGSVIGLAFGLIVSYVGAAWFGFTFVLSGGVLGITVGLSMLVGVVFGVYPAVKASKLRPVDALRNE